MLSYITPLLEIGYLAILKISWTEIRKSIYKLQKLKPADTEIYLLHQNERYLHKHWVAGQCKYQSCRLEFWWWGGSSFIINGLRPFETGISKKQSEEQSMLRYLSPCLLPQCLPDRYLCNNTSRCVAVILPWAEHYSQHRWHQSSGHGCES